MAFSTASVTLGSTTKKSDYDRLLTNTQELASGTITIKGVKTFSSATVCSATSTVKNLRMTAGGSPFYDPLGAGALGVPHPTALTTGDLNPANTNVTICTTFAGLPANCYLLCTVRLQAATAGRNVSIWQDASGTVPGIGTFSGLLTVAPGISSQIGLFFIKLDSSGNFYWQVNNSDVSLLNFTGIFYLI